MFLPSLDTVHNVTSDVGLELGVMFEELVKPHQLEVALPKILPGLKAFELLPLE